MAGNVSPPDLINEWTIHQNLPVETPGAQQCRIQYFGAVGGRKQD
jgi:hypothetical protein